MAEFYVLSSVGTTTPVEITGGRVGHFKIYSTNQALRLGDATVTSSTQLSVTGAENFDLYVTSPDEIYAVTQTGTTDIRVLHNR